MDKIILYNMFSFFSKYIFYFLKLDFPFSFRTYAGLVSRTLR